MSYFPEINVAETRTAPFATYESIKVKIDRGFNRVKEGNIEVAEGLAEMVATGAFKKHYKSIEAFIEAEYSKSRSWYYKIMRGRFPESVEKVHTVDDKPETKEQKSLSQVEQAREEEPEKPRVKTARESIADAAYTEREEAKQVPLECPKCLGSGWIGVKPKEVSEPCKCGCVLSVVVCQILAEHGIPSVGLTVGQAGLIMGKIKANNWKLPKAWEWVKSPGEWKVRQWRK